MKLPMKLLRIAGLCLVAMFVMSMLAAGTASAAWEQCATEKAAAAATKYETNQCLKVQSSGKWAWQEITSAEKVKSQGSLKLSDINIPIAGTVEVSCSGTDTGTVGPGKTDVTESITVASCTAGKNCEKLIKNAEPLHLPWKTELFNTEKTVRDAIKADGKGEPGWAVECKVLGVTKKDECTTETGTTLMSNVLTNGELLVLADFESKSGKAKCTVGGANSGEVIGGIANLKENGWGLRVT